MSVSPAFSAIVSQALLDEPMFGKSIVIAFGLVLNTVMRACP
jgi:hypothetical protein